jgi:RNA polymerase primary sigma factor
MQLPIGRRLKHSDITPEMETELARQCQAGDTRAGAALVMANEPMIYKFVRRYFRKGVRTEDIMQAARFGFYRGILRFDPAVGARLTTYALYWARNEAVDALQGEGPTIRIPRHVFDAIYKSAKTGEALDEETAEAARLLTTPSLDIPVRRDGSTRGDLEVNPMPGPEASAEADDAQRRRRELIQRALTWLTDREREIVERRFCEEPESYEAIGASLGFTKQRTEQIMKRALPKLDRAVRRVMAKDDWMLWGARGPLKPLGETARGEAESVEVAR